MFGAMAWSSKSSFVVSPRHTALLVKSTKRGPTLRAIKAQARRAMQEEEGVDFGPLSHAERNKLLFGH
jgi:hypothetical protein